MSVNRIILYVEVVSYPGYHVGAVVIAYGEDSFDGISIQGSLGRGFELGFSSGGNTNVISSISVSYEEQYEFGIETLKMFGWSVP